jgi:LuxR family maltose regulon positive regulatory protein
MTKQVPSNMLDAPADFSPAAKLRRSRLAYHPADAISGTVTLLEGPIGFGKSTLLGQWLHDVRARRGKAALLNLTDSDRTVAGLNNSLTAFAATIRPRGVASLSLDRLEQLLTSEQSLGFTLFLDDWDVIIGAESERRLGEIVRSGRLRANLCIASRRACGLPLDILLKNHQLRVIGPRALKFSPAEQRRLIGSTHWTNVAAELIHACDGWPLALALLLSVDGVKPLELETPSVFARRSGFEAILRKELAQACSAKESELLDILGLFADFDVPLLNAVRDASDSDELLQGIARQIPFDMHGADTALRYRSPALTRTILQRRFEATSAARQSVIAARAFQHAMAQGRTLDAINFALRSGDATRAIELFETIGPMRLMMMYGVEPIQEALNRVPLPLLAGSPRLKLAIPVTLAKRGYLAEAREMVKATIDEIEDSLIGAAPKRLALRDGIFVRMQVSASTNRKWAGEYEREAAAELVKEPAFAAWGTVIAGVVKHQIGALDDAEVLFDRAQIACEQIRADYQLVHLKLHRAHIELARGRFRAAIRILREVKHAVSVAYPSDAGLLAIAELALIEVSLATSRSSVQIETIDAALVQLKQSDSWYEPIAGALISMAQCLWRDGGIDGVLLGLGDVEADLCRGSITVVSGLSMVLRAFYLTLAGRHAAAEASLQSYESEERRSDDSGQFWRERHLKELTISMLAAVGQDLPRAIAVADRIIEDSRNQGRQISLLQAHLNRAQIVLPDIGMQTEGLNSLTVALEIAGDVGAGGALYEWRELIEDHAAVVSSNLHPRTREMLRRMLTEWQGKFNPNLSCREIDVLKAVAVGMSNKEISRQMDVSAETIKFHLKQCFRKLSAQTRVEAVRKAKDAQLI